MKSNQQLKQLVKEKYNTIAERSTAENKASCCGSGDCAQDVANIMTDDYSQISGYVNEADLGLGCGLPTSFARIQPGQTILDLGAGAGNDCFVARHETGANGYVIGVDFSPVMLGKARQNAQRMKFSNVEFREGDIENLPVDSSSIDVVISNCVLNLVPDKINVFKEIMRVLKPGGHFSISDIVLQGNLPDALRESAEMYAGCVSGAIQLDEYMELIKDTGFTDIEIQKKKPIHIPGDILSSVLSPEEISTFIAGETGIYSISVFGRK